MTDIAELIARAEAWAVREEGLHVHPSTATRMVRELRKAIIGMTSRAPIHSTQAELVEALEDLVAKCEKVAAELSTDSYYRPLGKSLLEETTVARIVLAKATATEDPRLREGRLYP
jgi:hypothetical protein